MECKIISWIEQHNKLCSDMQQTQIKNEELFLHLSHLNIEYEEVIKELYSRLTVDTSQLTEDDNQN
jgi:predicted nuclease with TOPRIM domain